jgi:antirestriction protein ArdC
MARRETERFNVSNQYQAVTDRIVAMLEAGTPPWRKSWRTGEGNTATLERPLRSNGQPYTGANVLNLWAASAVRGFSSRHWMTYKTAQEMGGQVNKGAKSELAFYVGKHTVEAEGENAKDRTFSFLKAYHVFNCDQITGLPARFYAAGEPAPVTGSAPDRMPAVDAFIDSLGVSLAHGGDKAFYMPSTDAVRMPHFEQFEDPAAYYSTLLHEMTHATGHASRCDRPLNTKRFGDEAYAAEELVAELGAAFLCADLAVTNEPRPDHAAYLASWIAVLKADNRAIFTAASLAEKAAGWMHAQQPAEALELAA